MGRSDRRRAPPNRPPGRNVGDGAPALERTIVALETTLDQLFAERRYREFFDRVHHTRDNFRTARLAADVRQSLWSRLNRLAEAAKERQAREFAERDGENLARWRDALARAEGYAEALHAEIGELAARGGSPVERDRWRRRIEEKQTRLEGVLGTVGELRRKIGEVDGRRERENGSRPRPPSLAGTGVPRRRGETSAGPERARRVRR